MVFKRLKILREEKYLTQEQLAKHLNVSRANIGKYENGLLDLNTEILLKYAKFFNVSTDYILEISNFREEDIIVPNNQVAVLTNDDEQIAPEELKKLIEFAKISGLFKKD